MDSAILFISDIHYSYKNGVSQFVKDDQNGYYQKWENYLIDLQHNNIEIKYLVVTGDIVNEAKKGEYDFITYVLRDFSAKFNISKENILLIPGNHDINWSKLSNYCDEKDICEDKAAELFDIKLSHFIDFYKNFFEIENFDTSKAILNSIKIEEIGVYIVGLNSLVKESHLEGTHVGHVDMKKLKIEMQEFTQKYGNKIFIATHHSFTFTGSKELPTLENSDIIKDYLNEYGINTYIYGHHHTSESKLDVVGDSGICHRYIEIGSLGLILKNEKGNSYTNRFSLAICKNGGMELHDYAYMSGDWAEVNERKYVHSIHMDEKPSTKKSQLKQLPRIATDEENEQREDIKEDKNNIIISEKSHFLIDYLRKSDNYREGHFHWKDGCKTLGWINIAGFLGNIDVLNEIRDSIMQLHLTYCNDIQVVLGYGMEGNIIGSSLIDYWISNDIDYYYYPSVHKNAEHINIEKTIWGEYNNFDKILILFDFMPTNAYLKEIIESNKKIKECCRLYVISLFCNRNLFKQDIEVGWTLEVRRVSLVEFNVQICDKDVADCLIYQQQIKKVYYL